MRPDARPPDPETPEQWQEAVNAANLWLMIDAARQYGLLTAPDVNVDRCEEVLARGKELGYTPQPVEDVLRLEATEVNHGNGR